MDVGYDMIDMVVESVWNVNVREEALWLRVGLAWLLFSCGSILSGT